MYTFQILMVQGVNVMLYYDKGSEVKGFRMGRSGKVSLWYVPLLINTRFRFLF